MRQFIGTSWKMNVTSTQALGYCETLRPLIQDVTSGELFILPPHTSIWAVREALRLTRVMWGAQDVHPEDWGAHTGDVSAPMLADLDCSLVEVGHSERRRDYGETDDYVAAQVAAVQRWDMTALVCVGEREQASVKQAMTSIGGQIAAVASADPLRLIIAYEPVWAIGTGARPADPAWIGDVHGAIHERIAVMWPGVDVPVIYGGSVDSAVAPVILEQPGVNGLFAGRSALDPVEFARIIHAGGG